MDTEKRMPDEQCLATMTRRAALLGAGAGLLLPRLALAGAEGPERRPVPRTGELLPVLGLGTSQVLDTPDRGAEFDAAAATLQSFLAGGGRVVDTSPMYGRAEARIGEILRQPGMPGGVFLATKIWTRGREEGRKQLAESLRLLGRPRLDLVQVHNLLDFEVQWRVLQEAHVAGQVRYLGITHYRADAHEELERVMRAAKPEFLQVNYSLAEAEAETRLLPAARDLGVAVLVNRPFTKGGMLERVDGKALPPVAEELGCETAAQLFLKWVLGHPAVTVALAGTRNPRHAAENLAAAAAPFPDAGQRRAIRAWFDSV